MRWPALVPAVRLRMLLANRQRTSPCARTRRRGTGAAAQIVDVSNLTR